MKARTSSWKRITWSTPSGWTAPTRSFRIYWAIRGIDFGAISRVYIFLSGLPAGTAARARFGRLEALRETPRPIRRPGLTVNGESLVFPITLEPDWYLEYPGTGNLRVFDANGFTQAEVAPEGNFPALQAGENQIAFFCDQAQDFGKRMKVTLITRGAPLR